MGLNLKLNPGDDEYQLYEGVDYKGFWEGRAKLKLDELEREIITGLLPSSGQRLIDIGCGFGRLHPVYERQFLDTILFDGSMSLLLQARSNLSNKGVFVAGDIYQMPFKDGAFDAALMIRVFHHLSDSKAGVAELQRIICDNGKLILNYKNKRNPLRFLRWILGRYPDNPLAMEPDGTITGLISHHPDYVHKILLDAGFDNFIYRGAGIMDKIVAKVGVLGKWVPSGKRLSPILGWSKISPWIFCACIAKDSHPFLRSKELFDLFACPSCHGDLIQLQTNFHCQLCNKTYPTYDGIFDFRI